MLDGDNKYYKWNRWSERWLGSVLVGLTEIGITEGLIKQAMFEPKPEYQERTAVQHLEAEYFQRGGSTCGSLGRSDWVFQG